MNLYLISQDENGWYDTYDSAVVAAETVEAAQRMEPAKGSFCNGSWTTPENVTVSFIGVAADGTCSGVILASFNAG